MKTGLLSLLMQSQAWIAWRLGRPFLRKRFPADEANTAVDLSQVQRVLVVRLNELGDLVMTTPFLRELRVLLPHAHITLLTTPIAAQLFQPCPYVDAVLVYDKEASRLLRIFQLPPRAWRFAVSRLRPLRFDLALDPNWFADNCYATFLMVFSGARWRVGPSENALPHKKRLNRGYNRLLTHPLPPAPVKHSVEHSLDILRFLGARIQSDHLELWARPEDEAAVDRLLASNNVKVGACLLALGPSGGHSALKQWPAERFIALGKVLQARYPDAVLPIVGGPEDRELCETIASALPAAINLAGKTTLRELAALLKRCQIYIGNDSGPMHIAAAAPVPVVAVFGSSCAHRFAPWGEHIVIQHDFPCRVCHQPDHLDRCKTCVYARPECLWQISVEEVMQAVEQSLRHSRLTRLPLRVSPSPSPGEAEAMQGLQKQSEPPQPFPVSERKLRMEVREEPHASC